MVASITMTDVDSTTMMDDNKKYYLDALNFYYPVIPSNPSSTSTADPDTGSCCSVKTDGCSVHSNVCSVTTDYGSVKVIKVMKVRTDCVKELDLEDRHDNDEDDRGGDGDNEDVEDEDDHRNSPVTTEENETGDDDDDDEVGSETHEADDTVKQKQKEGKNRTFWDRFYNMINPWNKDEESIDDSLSLGETASVSQSEDEIRSTDDPDTDQIMKEGTRVFPTCTGTVQLSSCQDIEEEMITLYTAFLDGVYDMWLPVANNACGPWNNEDEDSLYDSLSSESTGDIDLEGCECADHKTSLAVNQVLRRAAATKIDLDRLILSCHHSEQQSNAFITDEENVADVSSFTKSSPEPPFDDFILPHGATPPRNNKDDDQSALNDADKEAPTLEMFDHPASKISSEYPARKQDVKQVRFASHKEDGSATEDDAFNVPPQQSFDHPSSSSNISPKQSKDNQVLACDQSSLTEVNHCQSEEGDVVTIKVAKKLDSVAWASPPDESKQIHVTKVSSFKTSAKQPGEEPMLPYDLTVPSTNNDHSRKDLPVNVVPLETFARQTTHSILSPAAAKSRLVSLSGGIKRISKNNRLRSVLKSKKQQTPW